MRKIIVGAQVSMDGVMQAPGGPSEDPTKGFKFGGWVEPYFDQEFGEEIERVFEEKFDLLLGRKTYEIFAAYWPYYDADAPDGDIAEGIGRVDSGEGAIILTDLFGGTPSNLAISLMKTENIEVIAGVNLPMLIRLESARKVMGVHAAVTAAREAGRKYISVASEILGEAAA